VVDLSCEIARTCTRAFLSRLARSTYVVKEPIRYRLSGRFQFRAGMRKHERDARAYTNLPVLETCTNYASCAATVNPLRSQDIHLFSTTGELNDSFQRSSKHATKRISHSALMPFRHKPRRKTISLKKDHLEVLANNA
jgi:hypothetical protein